MSENDKKKDEGIVIFAVAVGIFIVAGIIWAFYVLSRPVQVPSVSVPEPTQQAPVAEEKKAEPIVFEGTGPQATRSFELRSGMARVEVSNPSTGYHGMWLIDSEGKTVELLANNLDVGSSSTVFSAVKGTYVVKVDSNGKWKLTITQ